MSSSLYVVALLMNLCCCFLINVMAYLFYFIFSNRSAETADAYSRACGPPPQLPKEGNAADAVKPNHDLQLVLKDLELLKVGCFLMNHRVTMYFYYC